MKILIVDCNQDMLTLFRQKFRKEIKAGVFDFSFFSCGETALEYINCHEEHPALVLILSNISLPGMSGTQLLETLKQKYPAIKIFMIAAVGSDRPRKRISNLRADYYFNQPVKLESIKIKILQLKKILG